MFWFSFSNSNSEIINATVTDLTDQVASRTKALRAPCEGSDVVYITQHGRPAAVLVDYEQL